MNLDSQVRPAYYRIIAVFQIASFSTHQIVSRQNLTLKLPIHQKTHVAVTIEGSRSKLAFFNLPNVLEIKLSRQYALMVIFIVMTLRTSEITVTPTKIDGNI